ncbi:hypothetical protein A1O3_00747 [Capronia epimyces CBS 606.96]|uniref:Cytochrome P450 n=1 Tax=Capronia epimyces CBS 606.96 TaxID=1182542 RepID=W9YH18_9EURO|nr:uncharacterized protein A1O3_00747 [Capronia epimyces CBS 606.96]EXJ92197.1 hypothetical protein A1O3_00747 [Capronia epimyces CBS 606.96]
MPTIQPFKALILAILALSLYHFYSRARSKKSPSLEALAWVGRNDAAWFFPNTRARLWNMMNYEKALKLAYDHYAVHNRPCILATLDGDVILLPPSTIPWLISQPEQVLSVNGAHKHILQTKYTFPRPEIMDPTVHFDVIKSELTRQVFNVTPEVCDELAAAVDEIWGTDTQHFTEVTLFDSITKIIARTSNRVFVGLPFCRDEEYIHNAVGFAEDIALSATLLRLFPGVIRPLVAPIITHPNRKHTRAFTRILTPEIVRRQGLQQVQGQEAGSDVKEVNDVEKESHSDCDGGGRAGPKNDFLQWLLTRSLTKPKLRVHPDETDPDIICARLLHTNFAAVHTTSFIGTNVVLDILSAPLSESVVDTLRAEAVETMDADLESSPSSTAKMWSRTSLAKMTYLDSALRESSRRASIIGVGINHKVVVPGGITTPEGTHLPEGSMVAVHSWGLHNDENIYSVAGAYRPFRFVELKEQIGRREPAKSGTVGIGQGEGEPEGSGKSGSGSGSGSRDEASPTAAHETDRAREREHEKDKNKEKEKAYLDKAHLQFIATSPTYLGFGHGRHSCPGRFFAANELKLLVAYLLTRYDIQMVVEGTSGAAGNDGLNGNGNGRGVRPECYWAGPNHVPPMGAKVRVRRSEV